MIANKASEMKIRMTSYEIWDNGKGTEIGIKIKNRKEFAGIARSDDPRFRDLGGAEERLTRKIISITYANSSTEEVFGDWLADYGHCFINGEFQPMLAHCPG
ncbi:MAG: hypothetical protein ACYC9R_13020 [Nitrosotalea sp.]